MLPVPRRSSSRKAKVAAVDFVKKVLSGKWEDTRDDVSQHLGKGKQSSRAQSSSPVRLPIPGFPAASRSRSGSPRVDENEAKGSPRAVAKNAKHTDKTTKPLGKDSIPQEDATEPKIKAQGKKKGFKCKPKISQKDSKSELSTNDETSTPRKDSNESGEQKGTKDGSNISIIPLMGVNPSTKSESPKVTEKQKNPVAPIPQFSLLNKVVPLQDPSSSVGITSKPDSSTKASLSPRVSLVRSDLSSLTGVVSKSPVARKLSLTEKSVPDCSGEKINLPKSKSKVLSRTKKSKKIRDLLAISPEDKKLEEDVVPTSAIQKNISDQVADNGEALIPDVEIKVEPILESPGDEPSSQENIPACDSSPVFSDNLTDLNQTSIEVPGPYPAQSEMAQFLNIFGLVKKSDIKQDFYSNKLHREAGGKLRRVVKPRMAPEMVYKKLTLTKSCVLQGISEKLPLPSSSKESSPRMSAKARLAQAALLKPKPKLVENKKAGVKLSLLEIEMAENLLKEGDLYAVRRLLLEGKVPAAGQSPKKKEWLKPPPKKKKKIDLDLDPDPDVKPEIDVKKKTSRESTPVKKLGRPKSVLGSPARPSLSRQSSTESAAPTSEDTASNARRSSRQMNAGRKQWWHLLRAAPDEYEEDKEWDKEQKRLNKKRKMLQVKKDHKMLIEQLDIKEEPMDDFVKEEEEDDDDDVLPSSQGSNTSTKSTGPTKKTKSVKKNEKVDPTSLLQMSNTSDINVYSKLYDELQPNKKPSRKKDWVLAKKVLQEARARGGEVSIESILLHLKKKELREQELREQAQKEKDSSTLSATPKKKKKRKKFAQSPEAGLRNPLLSSQHSAIMKQIRPLLENIIKDGNKMFGTLFEMELESHGSGESNAIAVVPHELMINKKYSCTVPHFCCVCWINDHMYCSNMKRIARDLPPSDPCLHYAPCEHYRKKIQTDGHVFKKPEEVNVESDADSSGLNKSMLDPVTASDLFCEEKMPESDESAPQSPGDLDEADILKLQLRARASMIAESLGVEQLQSDFLHTPKIKQNWLNQMDRVDHTDGCPSLIGHPEIPVNQHGSEVLIYCGRSYPPNHDFTDGRQIGNLLWLEDVSALQTEERPVQSEFDSKTNVKSKQNPVKDSSKLEVKTEKSVTPQKHRLICIKVLRPSGNRITMKLVSDSRNQGKKEEVLKEIDLPSSVVSENHVDVDWLSSVLAAEAFRQASKVDQTFELSFKASKPEERTACLTSKTSALTSVKKEPASEEDVAWTVETITDDDEDDNLPSSQASSVTTADDTELDPSTVSVSNVIECVVPDIPITIHHQSGPVPEGLHDKVTNLPTGGSDLCIGTMDIQGMNPDVIDYIKKNGLRQLIQQKLEIERKPLASMFKNSSEHLECVRSELEQKLCLRAALLSEKSMLQDHVRQKRDSVNQLAQTAGQYVKSCGSLEKKLIELERESADESALCKSILSDMQRAGLQEWHPVESCHVTNHNKQLSESKETVQSNEEGDSNLRDLLSVENTTKEPSPKEIPALDELVSSPLLGKNRPKPVDQTMKDTFGSYSKLSQVSNVKSSTSQAVDMVGTGGPPSFSINKEMIQTSKGQKIVVLQPMSVGMRPRVIPPSEALKSSSYSVAQNTAATSTASMETKTLGDLRVSPSPYSMVETLSDPNYGLSIRNIPPGMSLKPVSSSTPLVSTVTSSKPSLATSPIVFEPSQMVAFSGQVPSHISEALAKGLTKTLTWVSNTTSISIPKTSPVLVSSQAKRAVGSQHMPFVQVEAGNAAETNTVSSSLKGGLPSSQAPVKSIGDASILSKLPPGMRLVPISSSQALPNLQFGVGELSGDAITKKAIADSKQTGQKLIPGDSNVALQNMSGMRLKASTHKQSGLQTGVTISVPSTSGKPPKKQGDLGNVTVSGANVTFKLGHATGSNSIGVLPALPTGVQVHNATGQVCPLPQLAPNVLRSIGPNDQVVVLTAAQLQQLQKNPFKPVQIRIPYRASGPAPKVTISTLRHIAPKPQSLTSDPSQQKSTKKPKSAKRKLSIEAKSGTSPVNIPPTKQPRVTSPTEPSTSEQSGQQDNDEELILINQDKVVSANCPDKQGVYLASEISNQNPQEGQFIKDSYDETLIHEAIDNIPIQSSELEEQASVPSSQTIQLMEMHSEESIQYEVSGPTESCGVIFKSEPQISDPRSGLVDLSDLVQLAMEDSDLPVVSGLNVENVNINEVSQDNAIYLDLGQEANTEVLHSDDGTTVMPVSMYLDTNHQTDTIPDSGASNIDTEILADSTYLELKQESIVSEGGVIQDDSEITSSSVYIEPSHQTSTIVQTQIDPVSARPEIFVNSNSLEKLKAGFSLEHHKLENASSLDPSQNIMSICSDTQQTTDCMTLETNEMGSNVSQHIYGMNPDLTPITNSLLLDCNQQVQHEDIDPNQTTLYGDNMDIGSTNDLETPVDSVDINTSQTTTFYSENINIETIRELNFTDLADANSQDPIAFEIPGLNSNTNSDGTLSSRAVTVEVINTSVLPLINTPSIGQDSTQTVVASGELLENYSALEVESEADCCEFDQFMDEHRQKEVYSQEIYSQGSQGSIDEPSKSIDIDML